eukprot:283167-Prorocentrum_minimum.AAC.1
MAPPALVGQFPLVRATWRPLPSWVNSQLSELHGAPCPCGSVLSCQNYMAPPALVAYVKTMVTPLRGLQDRMSQDEEYARMKARLKLKRAEARSRRPPRSQRDEL